MNYKEIKKIKSKILDVKTNEIYPVEVFIEEGKFKNIIPLKRDSKLDFDGIMVPGFIDAHIHIESSLLTPSNFAKAVVPFGTTSVIADPHEIANVAGIDGINFMIDDAAKVPFDFYFSAPSCVPATDFETNGACLDSLAIEELLGKDEVVALGEMMNFPRVINRDPEVLKKLKIAKKYNKPIDGHAPLLFGEDLNNYLFVFEDKINKLKGNNTNGVNEDIDNSPTISTDHESISFNEAIVKKKLGMKIMVREGSSAKNMDALFNIRDRIALTSNQDFFGAVSADDLEVVLKHPIFDFLVSDDKDSRDLKEGHLNLLVKKAITLGIDPIEAIKMVTINPALHYNLNSGAIEEGKLANFVLIDNLDDFNIKKTIIHGLIVAEEGISFIESQKSTFKNTFNLDKKDDKDFDIMVEKDTETVNVRVIEVFDGEIVTGEIIAKLNVKDGLIQENVEEDILKLAVVERYGGNHIANGFIKGFNIKKGSLATSVAHDSHNIIVVGTDSADMARAVNLIVEKGGGLAIVSESEEKILKLPIAGLMSDKDVFEVSAELEDINKLANEIGCNFEAPFMSLSFMALLVIPSLKLSNKGLFDVDKFSFVDLIIY